MSQSIKNYKLLKLKYIFSLLFIILNLVFYIGCSNCECSKNDNCGYDSEEEKEMKAKNNFL